MSTACNDYLMAANITQVSTQTNYKIAQNDTVVLSGAWDRYLSKATEYKLRTYSAFSSAADRVSLPGIFGGMGRVNTTRASPAG